ncbi:hypothetical protein PC9H_005174 [Pleurotus ostreatus]|uniref:RRM domain-containing protein n=1 Tax=Pleurotus ostreatus TaxID=5322 RepID=A0A8H7DU57_PLEOS|nr:uncharacterized protein PC9H_005174 [Pleurotus ostreatus]KAF7433224.1 hypothetical protein PC9H_005174 [Pleurotus ostreatus]
MSDAPAANVPVNGAPPVAQEKIEEAPGFKVFVGNLAYVTTDEGLKAFFAPVQSEILSAHVILRGHRSAGYGFVALSSAEAVQKAAELLNKTELDGREVVVEVAKPSDEKDKERKEKKAKRRPGRRGAKAVPGEVTEAEANGEATKTDAPTTEGETESVAKPKKKKKSARKPKFPKAEGDVSEAPAPDAEGAAQAAPKKAGRVRKPRVSRPEGEDPAGEPSKTMLFVANLGFSVDDAGLTALFSEAGIHVVTARIVRRRYGKPRKSKGYGFVDVGSEEEQQKAIQALDGKEVTGRAIAVKVAVNTPHSESEGEGKDEANPDAPVAAAVPAEAPVAPEPAVAPAAETLAPAAAVVAA